MYDAAPGMWSGLGMRQRVRASHHPTTQREFCSTEGRWFFLVLFPHIHFSSQFHCICCSECYFSPAGVVWWAGGFIVMWENVICSSEGLFHRHCQLDLATFSWKQGRGWRGPQQEQLCLQPPSLCPLIRAGPCSPQRLLNWMLALACQQGHLEVVKLLVLRHGADPESHAVRKNEFPVIVRLPLYAAIKSGGCRSGRPWQPLSCRDAGSPFTLALHTHLRLSRAYVGFPSSVLGFFFKRSVSFFLPTTPSCEGISVPGTSHGKQHSSEVLQRAELHRSALIDRNLWSQGRQQRCSAAPCPFHFRFTCTSGLLDRRDTPCVPNALSALLSVL